MKKIATAEAEARTASASPTPNKSVEKPQKEAFENYFREHCYNQPYEIATKTEAVITAAKHGCVLLDGNYGVSILDSFDPAILLLPDDILVASSHGKQFGCHEFPCGYPGWLKFDEKMQLEVQESLFVRYFANYYDLRFINGAFYDQNGYVEDNFVKQKIYQSMEPFVRKNLSRITTSLFESVKAYTFTTLLPPNESQIFILGGKLIQFDLHTGEFELQEDNFAPTINRLPIKYDPLAECPVFSQYLRDLLYTEDLAALQEYMGYCLIPSTRTQAALFMKGEGGEGKSILTFVMKSIFGRSAAIGRISSLEKNRFAVSFMENKLVYIDDDLDTENMHETGTLKAVITANAPILVERKGQQAHEANIFARLFCLGNNHISAAFDRSDGFYRRQLLLTCKPIRPDRVTNKFLKDQIATELPGIFNWMLYGLQRLILNKFEFTLSPRALQEIEQKKLEDNPMLRFVLDTEWIVPDPNGEVTSKKLFLAFVTWCEDNAIAPPARKTVTNELAKQIRNQLKAESSKNIMDREGKHAGYKGCTLTTLAHKKIATIPEARRYYAG